MKIGSKIAVGFKIFIGMELEALIQNGFIVFLKVFQDRGVYEANNQLLISHTIHHLVVGSKEVCESVYASMFELIFISADTVLSDEPLSNSALEIKAND